MAEEMKDPSIAIFAGGCFWCTESIFDGFTGVISADPGYIGGDVDEPSYEEVSAGRTGHTEAVIVRFDPAKVDYPTLLNRYWTHIDPFDAGGQFADRGSQYRPAIFVLGEEQRKQAEESKAKLEAELGKKIAPTIEAATQFYVAEDFHKDYHKKNALRYKAYYYGSGRAARLEEVWGDKMAKPTN